MEYTPPTERYMERLSVREAVEPTVTPLKRIRGLKIKRYNFKSQEVYMRYGLQAAVVSPKISIQ